MKRSLILCLLLCVSSLFAEMDIITLRFGQEYFTPSGRFIEEIPVHLRPCMVPLVLQFLPQEDCKALEQFAGKTHCERVIRRFLQLYGTKKLADKGVPNIYNDVWALLKEVAAKKQVPLEPEVLSSELLTTTWNAEDAMLVVTIMNPYEDAQLEISGALLDAQLPLTLLKPKEQVQFHWNVTNSKRIKPAEPVKEPIETITPVFVDGKPYLLTVKVPIERRRHMLRPEKNEPFETLQICAPCQAYEQHSTFSNDELGIYFQRTSIFTMKGTEKKTESFLELYVNSSVIHDRIRFTCLEENPAQIVINGQVAGLLTFKPKEIGERRGQCRMSGWIPLNERIHVAGKENITLKACLVLPNGQHLRVNRETVVLLFRP